eukprot:XP_001696760.1 predicted protein [Chlamydomonas reinhardtii]
MPTGAAAPVCGSALLQASAQARRGVSGAALTLWVCFLTVGFEAYCKRNQAARRATTVQWSLGRFLHLARFGSTEHVAATVLEAQQAPPLLSKASLAVFTAAPGSPAITHSALCESRSHSTATSGSEPRSAVPSRQASLPAGGPPGNDTGADEHFHLLTRLWSDGDADAEQAMVDKLRQLALQNSDLATEWERLKALPAATLTTFPAKLHQRCSLAGVALPPLDDPQSHHVLKAPS